MITAFPSSRPILLTSIIALTFLLLALLHLRRSDSSSVLPSTLTLPADFWHPKQWKPLPRPTAAAGSEDGQAKFDEDEEYVQKGLFWWEKGLDLSLYPSENITGKMGAIVSAGMTTTDVSWMDEFADNFTLHPYIADLPGSQQVPPPLRMSRNKAHEALPYLSYIITHYDQLPDVVIFTHGHATSWHQDGATLAERIRALRDVGWTRLTTGPEGFVNLRCDWYPSCPAEIRLAPPEPQTPEEAAALEVVWGPGVNRKETEDLIRREWAALFPDHEMPAVLASVCCAQFAATRDAIRRWRKRDWVRIRNWALAVGEPDDISGRVMEKVWAWMLTGDAVHCPAPPVCTCEYYGRCDNHQWGRPPAPLKAWDEE